jgi:hypothetical protein
MYWQLTELEGRYRILLQSPALVQLVCVSNTAARIDEIVSPPLSAINAQLTLL